MKKTVTFARQTPVPQPPPGWHALAYAITLDGHLALMWTDCDVRALHEASRDKDGAWQSFDVPDHARARISLFDGQALNHSLDVPLVHYPHVLFDRLPDGRWIIIGRHRQRGDPHAHLIAGDGSTSTVRLGDDILHLQCAADNKLWAGYNDVGCLTSTSIARHGIVRATPAGRVTWGLNADKAFRHHWADSVECLNVSNAGVFAVIWPGYVIVRLDTPRPKFLRGRTECPDALATANGHFMLSGGFAYDTPGDRNRLTLLGPPSHAGSRRLRRIWRGTFDRPPRETERLLLGRGDCLHAVTDTIWSRLTVTEALDQLPRGVDRYWDRTDNNPGFAQFWDELVREGEQHKKRSPWSGS